MFEQKKPSYSPFGGGDEKSEEVKIVGEKKAAPPKKADVKGMVKNSIQKKKKSAKEICGCF